MADFSNSKPITRRLKLVFLISVTLLLSSSLASYYSIHMLIENSVLVNKTNDILMASESIISSMKDAETGHRGYLITHDESFLKPYNGARERVMKNYGVITSLSDQSASQQKNIVQIKVLIDEKFRQMQRTIDMVRMGYNSFEDSSDRAIQYREMLKGKKVMDDLRLIVDNIQNQERLLLSRHMTMQGRFIAYTPLLLVVVSLLSIAITVIAYYRIKNDLAKRKEEQRLERLKYKETAERIGKMEEVTRQLADGNYHTRSTDGTKDELGKIATALNEMAGALEASFNDLNRRNWLQTGAVLLANEIRGERNPQQVSARILKAIAEYSGAEVGVLYLATDGPDMKLSAAYAATNVPEYTSTESGLLAKALKQKHCTLLHELPKGYLTIHSTLGQTDPTTIAIQPLKFGNDIVGVIELGYRKNPGATEIEFLEQNSEPMAISLSSAINFEKMQELLEETQAQAEELQAQHCELENLNTELEAQAQKLHASEEELRLQQLELQQSNRGLAERSRLLEEKNKEIQQKAEELAVSTRYKSEFMANMSHELRTPLNSILLLSRLLSENKVQNLSDDQVEYARVILSSGQGLLALIDEILDLSKIESGKMELELGQVSLREIAENMNALFKPLTDEKKLSLVINIPDTVPEFIESDKMRLEQILKNLLSNAIKFTAEGSVWLEASVEKGYLRLDVRDTGIGIEPEKQSLIFEAFRQADGSTRRKFGGTGLGLSISRELVRLLGGSIEVDSTPGQGSCFTVYLPLAASPAYPMGEEYVESPPDDHYTTFVIPEAIPDDRDQLLKEDKTILIIEDDAAFARSLLDYTRKQGYKGVVAVRGDEGIRLAEKLLPDAILLDLQLPVKNGWQVIESLKKNRATRNIPVHIMSVHPAKKESQIKGAFDFLQKPVSEDQVEQIFRKLEQVLNHSVSQVLIVEENPMHSKALKWFLESCNIPTIVTDNISSMTDALNSGASCVILDMGPPDDYMYHQLEQLRKMPEYEHLPVIVFTARSLSSPEEQKIRQVADSVVLKTANAYKRILDEISLFLHLVEENLSDTGQRMMPADVLTNKTVLVVDDDVRNVFSLTKALENAGMKVLTATDGREALQQLEQHPETDIVLMDMMMPHMDGYETSRRIRLHETWRSLPVIAVTAKAMSGDREKCIEAGASDYITKPADIDQLISLLRVWLYEKHYA